jgi:hypothetical protein
MKLTNDRGRSVRIEVPPRIRKMARKMQAELEKLARLEAARDHHRDELTRLQGDLERAELKRAADIREAALAEKALPSSDPTKKIREAIDLAKSRIAGFEDAITAQEEIVVVTLEQDRPELVEAALERRTIAVANVEKAIDELVATRAELIAALEDAEWLAGFPRHKAGWSAEPGSIVVGKDLVLWQTIEVALRQDADPERRLKVDQTGMGVGQRMPVPARDEKGRAVYSNPLARGRVANRTDGE